MNDPVTDPSVQTAAPEYVSPEVQQQRDKEARVESDRIAAEEQAQQELADREAREAAQLTENQRVAVAMNQRVHVSDEAVFLAETGHNTEES